MRVKTCLKPGQKGTKKWCKIYGDNLVSVRYRYDVEKRRRYTTIEIIVGEGEWQPDEKPSPQVRNTNDLIGIQVAFFEFPIREQVKSAGGIWRSRQKLWELPYGQVLALGLEDRIVDGQELGIL